MTRILGFFIFSAVFFQAGFAIHSSPPVASNANSVLEPLEPLEPLLDPLLSLIPDDFALFPYFSPLGHNISSVPVVVTLLSG